MNNLKKVKLVNTDGEIKYARLGFSWLSLIFLYWVPIFKLDFRNFFIEFFWYFIFCLPSLISSQLNQDLACVFLFLMYIPWFYFAFNYKKMYIKTLLKKGYTPADSESEYIIEKYKLNYSKYEDLLKVENFENENFDTIEEDLDLIEESLNSIEELYIKNFKLTYNVNPPSKRFSVNNLEETFFCELDKSLNSYQKEKIKLVRLSDGTINVFYGSSYVGKIKLQGRKHYMQVLYNLDDFEQFDGTLSDFLPKIDYWVTYIIKYSK